MARGCRSSSGRVWICWVSCILMVADSPPLSFSRTAGVAAVPVRSLVEWADDGSAAERGVVA
jgi:hypothetical protein